MAGAVETRRSFSITTLGCKLNQFESECIRQYLVKRNWQYRPFPEEARFYIINTCTVTGKTDSRCRNAIRRARRASPRTTIIVTGCYAETQSAVLESMPETDYIVGNDDKTSIVTLMENILREEEGLKKVESRLRWEEFSIDGFLDHARAFIKIQDGCNSSCSYCIIPRARGVSRSVPPGKILRQIEKLGNNGFEEIVLTGIHIGRYGKDLPRPVGIESLLEMILDRTRGIRFRLSSIEVTEITPGLIDLMAGSERLAPHLHIPLQSGDDEILRAMNRPYDRDFFSSTIDRIKDINQEVTVGTDIIVGFPGETDERFRNTLKFLKDLPLDYFHVFPFSKRPGTRAEKLPHQVRPQDKKERSRKLIRLGKAKRKELMRRQTGKRKICLVQGPVRKNSRFSLVMTGNYCEVHIRCSSRLIGKLAPVDITHFSRGRLYGRLCGSPASAELEDGEQA
ncbi:MAG: tRNA (N(6)-L-threonylcarbamoyladenosine(37)-C(2))-methylthiotransferase MtaB [Candidatus Krumholzibacteriota bacterium]|nr:tRNA (N(6)-L-threonylcarbamoyladenosine(37)-C(2))-methylthiotransferase MtaB [Candidatus Krumholzibacteriota bacterium]